MELYYGEGLDLMLRMELFEEARSQLESAPKERTLCRDFEKWVEEEGMGKGRQAIHSSIYI